MVYLSYYLTKNTNTTAMNSREPQKLTLLLYATFLAHNLFTQSDIFIKKQKNVPRGTQKKKLISSKY